MKRFNADFICRSVVVGYLGDGGVAHECAVSHAIELISARGVVG